MMNEQKNYKKYRALLDIIAIRNSANPYKSPSDDEIKLAKEYRKQSLTLEAIRQRTFLGMMGEEIDEQIRFNQIMEILNSEEVSERNIGVIHSKIDGVISDYDYDYEKSYEKRIAQREERAKAKEEER